MLAAVSLPATAQRFFQAFLGDEAGPPPLSRSTVVGAVIFYLALCASQFIGAESAARAHLVRGGLRRLRVRRPVLVGLLPLPALPGDAVAGGEDPAAVPGGGRRRDGHVRPAGPDLRAWGPSFANIFITVYLYFLSQNLVRYRLLDLNELLGRMMVLATLVFILTLVYGVLVMGGPEDSTGCSSSTR